MLAVMHSIDERLVYGCFKVRPSSRRTCHVSVPQRWGRARLPARVPRGTTPLCRLCRGGGTPSGCCYPAVGAHGGPPPTGPLLRPALACLACRRRPSSPSPSVGCRLCGGATAWTLASLFVSWHTTSRWRRCSCFRCVCLGGGGWTVGKQMGGRGGQAHAAGGRAGGPSGAIQHAASSASLQHAVGQTHRKVPCALHLLLPCRLPLAAARACGAAGRFLQPQGPPQERRANEVFRPPPHTQAVQAGNHYAARPGPCQRALCSRVDASGCVARRLWRRGSRPALPGLFPHAARPAAAHVAAFNCPTHATCQAPCFFLPACFSLLLLAAAVGPDAILPAAPRTRPAAPCTGHAQAPAGRRGGGLEGCPGEQRRRAGSSWRQSGVRRSHARPVVWTPTSVPWQGQGDERQHTQLIQTKTCKIGNVQPGKPSGSAGGPGQDGAA